MEEITRFELPRFSKGQRKAEGQAGFAAWSVRTFVAIFRQIVGKVQGFALWIEKLAAFVQMPFQAEANEFQTQRDPLSFVEPAEFGR